MNGINQLKHHTNNVNMYNYNKQNSNKIKTEGIKSNQKLDLILNANYNDCKQRKEMKLYHIILYIYIHRLSLTEHC